MRRAARRKRESPAAEPLAEFSTPETAHLGHFFLYLEIHCYNSTITRHPTVAVLDVRPPARAQPGFGSRAPSRSDSRSGDVF
ncbi:hypothetical protein EVAR_18879_1 [Eumeta japonica]|uniref:Uncharacterized protein n=1 Tax=Eumeta variegata TaxID=151549 RepID=A0A4C1V378_EUMVA|nr:hypothetical protein EVAR_18879_1 [Eumeta japonica]